MQKSHYGSKKTPKIVLLYTFLSAFNEQEMFREDVQ